MLHSYHHIPALVPPRVEDVNRWEHTGLRVRMLRGQWKADLERALQQHLGRVRRSAWGKPDQSSNVFKSIAWQLAVLYDRWPTVMHTEKADGYLGPKGTLAVSGVWSLMQRVLPYTLGCREYLLRINASERGELSYRAVAPSYVSAQSLASDPMRPVIIEEARLRQVPGADKPEWLWDCFDISEPGAPSFKVLRIKSSGDREDLSELFIGGASTGDSYPYRYSDGEPFLPYVLYHAALTGELWDPYEGIEVVEGSLNAAVGWSMFFHCFRDASWPQRYGVNVQVPGASVVDVDDGRRAEVVTDPTSLLMLESNGEPGQALVGQWNPGADVSMLADTLTKFEARIAEFYGVSPADIQRLGGQARSGYAISISRSGQRAASARLEPIFRLADLEMTQKSAALLNRATGSSLPEGGYSISYANVGKSPDEMKADREHVEIMLDRGLMSKVDALQYLHPDWTREAAIAELDRIRRDQMAFAV